MMNAGERVANNFDEWHDKQHRMLLPIAKRLCWGAREIDPEDLVQEALLRFIETYPDALEDRKKDPMDGWLISVMTRHFVDLKRGAMARMKAEDDPAITRWTLGQGGGSTTYERITQERFDWAVNQLPLQQRLTLLLRAQGMRNQEIAGRLGLKSGVVAKRLFDARQKLGMLLKPYVDEGTH
ncbi:sigma factor-like helix-turn-helix DNA-binding protein [Stigmatella sp. ncwal1]|uniref:Sigma factor-like helix-turn-helix DNA-binding protein n=1 Tax=Stigmatella ashevillensis TaxID=2995309 RepID=A0ABT5DG80_9BACT|nr:sigma factor-like helix-turn-helix DNA-binding protein [Stigmatella ashevillena]MDC0712679.1 sigma factor-like helix-turn-helix DNA-binding protein [Stigmatella ashevillena]